MISGGLGRLSTIRDANKNHMTGFSRFGLMVVYADRYKHYGEGKKINGRDI